MQYFLRRGFPEAPYFFCVFLCFMASLTVPIQFSIFSLRSRSLLLHIILSYLVTHSQTHWLLNQTCSPLPSPPLCQSACQSWLSSGLPLTLSSRFLLPVELLAFSRLFLSDGAHLATVPVLSSDWGLPEYEGRFPLPLSINPLLPGCRLGGPTWAHHVGGQ